MLKFKKQLSFKSFFNISNFISLLIIFLMLCLIISPAKYIASASAGIMLWAQNLLPALFPFFILTKILMELNILEKYTKNLSPLMRFCFGTSNTSSYIFIISILSGYPLGSKLVADAYNSGKITQREAYKIVTFTSVSGPLFIVGTVGTSMLISPLSGYIILISHILGAILNGFTYKKNSYIQTLENDEKVKIKSFNSNILTNSIKSSIDSILLIGGLVCIFYVGMEAISSVIHLPAFIQGLIEITTGCNQIANLTNYSVFVKTILSCIIITFGGLCTHAQAMYFLKQCNITYSFFLKQKLTHTLYSALICLILCSIFF